MAVTTEKLAHYLHLPPDSVEELSIYINAAKSKARTAGIRDFQNNAEYDMFIITLAASYYENRAFMYSSSYPATAEEAERNRINAAVLALRYAEEDPDPSAEDE